MMLPRPFRDALAGLPLLLLLLFLACDQDTANQELSLAV